MRNGATAARIAVIPGDGIGAEVTPEAVKVLIAVTAPSTRSMEFVEFDWGADKFLREGVTLWSAGRSARAFEPARGGYLAWAALQAGPVR
jgi:isocitrate/isopropylmalate dehydrogenase